MLRTIVRRTVAAIIITTAVSGCADLTGPKDAPEVSQNSTNGAV